MEVLTTVAEMQQLSRSMVSRGSSIGCVPTMGALHPGHASLIKKSAEDHPVTVTSVFVNPTQFGPTEDFSSYPRSLDRDIKIVAENGGTHIFAPSVSEMFPGGYSTEISVGAIADVLEGASRPGHFAGVATIVCKLLNAMLPHEVYFGQKDYQQTLVVRKMISDLLIPVRVSILPTIREQSGLALSSRNQYLTSEQMLKASTIFKALAEGSKIIKQGATVYAKEVELAMQTILGLEADLEVEYAVCVDPHTLAVMEQISKSRGAALLIAARVGSTRLIDNVIIEAQ
jgi:pantoate--beta-alanine ligase